MSKNVVNAFVVEDVPVKGRERSKYGWERVGVGQSIVVDKNAVSAANNWGKKIGAKFASEKLADGKFRIGRVS